MLFSISGSSTRNNVSCFANMARHCFLLQLSYFTVAISFFPFFPQWALNQQLNNRNERVETHVSSPKTAEKYSPFRGRNHKREEDQSWPAMERVFHEIRGKPRTSSHRPSAEQTNRASHTPRSGLLPCSNRFVAEDTRCLTIDKEQTGRGNHPVSEQNLCRVAREFWIIWMTREITLL